MSEWMRGSRGACDRFAPTLALLDDPASSASLALHPAERAAALEHLASCPLCQADHAADARLDAALRRAFSPQAAAAPLRTRDLLLAIGATHEPAPHITVTPARGAASPIRSVVDLGDFEEDVEEGFDQMSESDEANEATSATDATIQTDPTSETGQRDGQPTPARKMAAIPSLRPAPRPRGQRGRPSSQALAVGFSATAAAVILVVVAATLFASRGRAPAHTSAAQHASATATTQAKLAATATGPIVAISFDSPTDGWALGDATPQQPASSNAPVTSVAALYHYDGRQWTLKQRISGYAADAFEPSSLKMFSATDGWAFGGSPHVVLHYDGTMWSSEPMTLSGGDQVQNLLAADIVSPTEGWAAAYISPGGGGSGIGFLRFDGSQWTVEQQGIKLPSDFDPQSLMITRMAALPGGDAWAIGNANLKVTASVATATANAGNSPDERGFLIHRAHGAWTVDDVASLPANAVSSQFNGITMTSPTSGWVVGQVTVNLQIVGGGPMAPVQQSLVLRYDGARWSVVRTPQDSSFNTGTLSSVTASGPDDVWALVQTSGGDINANGERVSALFLHYDGATWTQVQGIFPGISTTSNAGNVLVSAMSLGPDGTLWSMGATLKVVNQQGISSPLIVSYRDGAWSMATIVTK